MGFFSGGGWSFPDTIIATLLFVCAVVAIILNVLIIRSNFSKAKITAPTFLFICLAANDLVTALVLPIYVGVKVLEVEEPVKTVEQAKERSRPATTAEKVHGTLVWVVIYTPCFITGLMTVVRYLSKAKPFYRIPISRLAGVLILLIFYQIAVCIAQAVGSEAKWLWEIKVLFNPAIFGLPEWASFVLLAFFAVSIIIVSMFMSIRLVMLLQETTVQTTQQRYSRRVSQKILILNFGSIIFSVPNLCGPFMSRYRHGDDVPLWFYCIPGFVIVSFLPSFLSAFNPIIYVIFSYKGLKNANTITSMIFSKQTRQQNSSGI